MTPRPFRGVWLLSAVGCGLLLSALLWQPPFQRQLTMCAVGVLVVAVVSLLKRLVGR